MSETTVKPFIGPRPFNEADSPFFYGRDREVQEILALILSAPVSLIYAKSGIGKTSIFNAKILPELKKGRFKSNVLPVARVKTIGTTEDLTPKSEKSNIYIYNAFQS